MRDSQTFAAHAERCHREAEDSPLALVRERARRAEAAWMILAERSLKTEAIRDARQQREAAALLVQDLS